MRRSTRNRQIKKGEDFHIYKRGENWPIANVTRKHILSKYQHSTISQQMMKRFYAINDHSKYFSSLSIKYLLFMLIYSYIFSYSQSTNLAYFWTTRARSTEYWIMFTLTTRGRLSASIVSADTRSIVSTVTRSTVGQHISRHSVSFSTWPTLDRTIDTWPILDRYLTDTLPMLWYIYIFFSQFKCKAKADDFKTLLLLPIKGYGYKANSMGTM